MAYKAGKKKNPKSYTKLVVILLLSLGLLVASAGIGLSWWYKDGLQPKTSESKLIIIDITEGESAHDIALELENKGVIKSAKAFEWYTGRQGIRGKLQAGRYELDSAKSATEIADIISRGEVSKHYITILPGKRLDQIKSAFLKAGFSDQAIEEGFNPNLYRSHPALLDKPKDASLEGYLYPETFQITSKTTVNDIVRSSLDEMANHLTQARKVAYAEAGLSPHQAVILASIVLQESGDKNEQPTIAQVFLKRFREGIKLGSDVTYFYAAAISGEEPSPSLESPYNTRKYEGLPPGPISNVTDSALEAMANPNTTEYLFFVAGDDGTVHYSYNFEQHQALVEKYCTKACGR